MNNKSPEFPQLPFLTRDMIKFGSEAQLGIQIISQCTNSRKIAIRGLTRSGLFDHDHTTSTAGAKTTENVGIDDIPIMLSVIGSGGVPVIGECYVSVTLTINQTPMFEIASGFVSAQKGISWPASNSEPSIVGHGEFDSVSSPNPDPDENASIQVPDKEMWLIHSAIVPLVTDATVANRRVHLLIAVHSGINIQSWSSYDQTASLSRNYSFAQFGAIPDDVDDNDIMVPLAANMWVEPGAIIQTTTTNMQSGDNYGSLRLAIERYFVA